MLESPLDQIDPDIVLWSVRSFYIFASYAIIIVRFIPDLQNRFLDYGARASDSSKVGIDKNSAFPRWIRLQIDPLLDSVAEITVPHSWFSHFYVVSTISSAIWISIFIRAHQFHLSEPLSIKSVWELRTLVCMILLQLQGLRRLYECVFMAKPSKSRMWVGHYCIGIAFYLVTNIAIWLEPVLGDKESASAKQSPGPFQIGLETLRVVFCLYSFVKCSYEQHQVHKYLANLRQYQVPNHRIYQETNLICPHYWFEITIYIIFSVLSARDMRILNTTMVCALGFVVVNLGITADMTKKWLLVKFPRQRSEIVRRKRMIGGIW